MGYCPSDIDILVLTHRHADHAGGRQHICELAPDIRVVTDVQTLTTDISIYAMPGHTEDCIGIFDRRTHTLISGDGLQGAGVDKFRCYTQNPTAYSETLKKIENDERIENILFSHAYEPWNKDSITGRNKVLECLSDCMKYI
jgi:glyoxylase-like metal-dependent hydrolase (beta-lactamase superfamily II)